MEYHDTQHRQILYALTTDSAFPQPQVSTLFHGKVEQIFSKAINIFCEQTGELYSLICSQLDPAPNSCRLLIKQFDDLAINIGDDVYLTHDYLVINTCYFIDFSLNKIWQPKTISFTPLNQAKNHYWLETAKTLESYIQTSDSLFNYHGDNAIYQQSSKQLIQFRQQLIHAFLNNNPAKIKNTVSHMIGLGIGLTPTADDYLSGLSVVLFMPNHPAQTYQLLFDALIKQNRAQTTLLSAITLEKAINNQSRESVLNLVNKIFCEFATVLQQEIEAVLQIGSSSGSDMLYGMVDALYLTHHFTNDGLKISSNSNK